MVQTTESSVTVRVRVRAVRGSNRIRTAKGLLPAHLREEVVGLRGEVGDLRALFVALRLREYAVPCLHREVLARVGDREHDLLQCAIVSHDLHLRAHFSNYTSTVHAYKYCTIKIA